MKSKCVPMKICEGCGRMWRNGNSISACYVCGNEICQAQVGEDVHSGCGMGATPHSQGTTRPWIQVLADLGVQVWVCEDCLDDMTYAFASIFKPKVGQMQYPNAMQLMIAQARKFQREREDPLGEAGE